MEEYTMIIDRIENAASYTALGPVWEKAFEIANGVGLFDKVCGTDYVREVFSKGYNFADIKEYWRKDEKSFRALSQKYHLY